MRSANYACQSNIRQTVQQPNHASNLLCFLLLQPYLHICTTALFCPLYSVLTGLTAITFQLTASVCGVTINLILVLGALNKIAW